MINNLILLPITVGVVGLASIGLYKNKKNNEETRRELLISLCKEDAEKTLRESRECDKYVNISSSLIDSDSKFIANNFYFSDKKVSFEDIVTKETVNGWKYYVQPTKVEFTYYFWNISMSRKIMVKVCFSLIGDEKSLMRSKYEYANVYQCM